MFTARQYRAEAIKYAKLIRIAKGPNEVREFERELADNAQWVTDNNNKIARATERRTAPLTPAVLRAYCPRILRRPA